MVIGHIPRPDQSYRRKSTHWSPSIPKPVQATVLSQEEDLESCCLCVNRYLLGSLPLGRGFGQQPSLAVVNISHKGINATSDQAHDKISSLIGPLIYKGGLICQWGEWKRMGFSSWSYSLVVNELFICVASAPPLPSLPDSTITVNTGQMDREFEDCRNENSKRRG